MKLRYLPIALFVAGPALGQPPVGATSPKVVEAPDRLTADKPDRDDEGVSATIETDEEFARRWEREQAIYGLRERPDLVVSVPISVEDLASVLPESDADNDAPLPLPCGSRSEQTSPSVPCPSSH